MLFYTLCFSLGDPKTNLYVYNVVLLYKSLVRSGTLTASDTFLILADQETAKRFEQFPLLKNAKLLVIPKVKSVKEGMIYKYRLPEMVNLPDGLICHYLDSDLLSIRPLHTYLPPDYLCVFPEGKADDTNYCGDPLPAGATTALRAGYTAGFFAYSLGQRTRGFLKRVAEQIANCDKKWYTLDQPLFNKNLDPRFLVEYNSDCLSFNGHTNIQSCRYINLCGEPGDQLLHFDKMLNTYLSVF